MRFLVPVAAAALAASSPALAGSHRSWGTASTIGRDTLVVTALGLPAAQGDWTGDKQAALALGGSWAITEALKRVTHEERPDHSNDLSFPSGHASSSFAAAAVLEKRYGWKIGIPAHLVAAFVGIARVEAKKHFVHDVIAGAAIGEAAGWLVSSKKNSKVQWLPYGDRHGGGVTAGLQF
jgi:membrane-associated phospholipid phosphatase